MSHEVAEADQNLREIARLRAELAATRADLDTLRNGVAWLGAELDRAKRWGALWKRAAKDERGNALSSAQMQAQTHKYFLASCADSEAQRSRNTEMADALRAYLKAQRRMLEKWADGSAELKTALWRDLHACEDAATTALDRSADADVARILSMSDDEILAEVRAEGGDPEKIALEGRLTFERARNEVLKAENAALQAQVLRLGGRLVQAKAKEQARDDLQPLTLMRDNAALWLHVAKQRRALRLLVAAWRQERAAAAEHSINAWRLEGILRGERARRQDAETALLDMRAQKETEQPQ